LRLLRTSVAELSRMGRAGADRVRSLHNAQTEAARLKDLLKAHVRPTAK